MNSLNKPNTTGIDVSSTSSANNDIVCLDDPIVIGGIIVLSLNFWARGSIESVNNIVDRGQPYLVPLAILNSLECKPLVEIMADGFEYITLIIPINFSPSPNFSNTIHIYCHSSHSSFASIYR